MVLYPAEMKHRGSLCKLSQQRALAEAEKKERSRCKERNRNREDETSGLGSREGGRERVEGKWGGGAYEGGLWSSRHPCKPWALPMKGLLLQKSSMSFSGLGPALYPD